MVRPGMVRHVESRPQAWLARLVRECDARLVGAWQVGPGVDWRGCARRGGQAGLCLARHGVDGPVRFGAAGVARAWVAGLSGWGTAGLGQSWQARLCEVW